MRSLPRVCGTLFLALVMTGCAVVPPPQGENILPLQAEMAQIRNEQQDLALQLNATREKIQEVRALVREQELSIAELRERMVAQKVTGYGEKAANVPETKALPPKDSAAPGSPTEIYLKAFADYASGRYQQAILGFEAFMEFYPGNYYADNAQYWLGECYYAQEQFSRAVEEFRKVAENYPQGSKTPEALFKIASALQELNRDADAEEALELLRRKYPDSAAAQKSLQAN